MSNEVHLGLLDDADHEAKYGATMPRFEDMLPAGTEAEWSCGHVGGAVCAECFRLLAAKAHELAEENLRLKEQIEKLEREAEAGRALLRRIGEER